MQYHRSLHKKSSFSSISVEKKKSCIKKNMQKSVDIDHTFK